jgi:dTDP-4-amino-4,6-dideoxygalactose transaminase
VAGCGSSALYLAIKALGKERGKVILPAILCPSVANVILFAGLEPLFCDVNLDDFTIDVQALKTLLASHDDLVAVIAVHLFGHPADMESICSACWPYNVRVIEDAAQALGGSCGNRPIGKLGDLSVLSFGHTKILDVGGGGAVLTDDADLYGRLQMELQCLPEKTMEVSELQSEYRTVYYTLLNLTEKNSRFHQLFHALPVIFRSIYLYSLTEKQAGRIIEAWGELKNILDMRSKHAQMYNSTLDHPEIRRPSLREGSVCWRYTFLLLNERQKEITERLRNTGVDVSNWYPSLHRWYMAGCLQDEQLLPNSLYLEKHVVNLWVDATVDSKRIQQNCELLMRLLDEDGGGLQL